jgi:hypothetical protein
MVPSSVDLRVGARFPCTRVHTAVATIVAALHGIADANVAFSIFLPFDRAGFHSQSHAVFAVEPPSGALRQIRNACAPTTVPTIETEILQVGSVVASAVSDPTCRLLETRGCIFDDERGGWNGLRGRPGRWRGCRQNGAYAPLAFSASAAIVSIQTLLPKVAGGARTPAVHVCFITVEQSIHATPSGGGRRRKRRREAWRRRRLLGRCRSEHSRLMHWVQGRRHARRTRLTHFSGTESGVSCWCECGVGRTYGRDSGVNARVQCGRMPG